MCVSKQEKKKKKDNDNNHQNQTDFSIQESLSRE